jgi:hypothetical protein
MKTSLALPKAALQPSDARQLIVVWKVAQNCKKLLNNVINLHFFSKKDGKPL